MGTLPQKYQGHQKLLKLMAKTPNNKSRFKDFEFDRVQTTRESLMHFLNGMMAFHSAHLNYNANMLAHSQNYLIENDAATRVGSMKLEFLRRETEKYGGKRNVSQPVKGPQQQRGVQKVAAGGNRGGSAQRPPAK